MISLVMLLSIGLAIGGQDQGDVRARSDSATVGDTIWLRRTVAVTPRQTVRPAEWDPPDPIELIRSPTVTVRGGTAEIRYPITIWRSGKHRVEIPGPLVLGANGTADSLPPYVVTLSVASVLPAAPIDSVIQPQPPVAVVPRRGRTIIPLLVLWAVALAVLLPLRWWWVRRGKPTGLATTKPSIPGVPVERWMDAGEYRAVASVTATRLRMAAGQQTSSVDVATEDEVTTTLATLDRARFGSISSDDIATLVRRAQVLEDRLSRGHS